MPEPVNAWRLLRQLSWRDAVWICAVMILAWGLALLLQRVTRDAAEHVPPRLRLLMLRVFPLVRLAIVTGAVVAIVPRLVEPTFQNVVTLVASVGVALAFALKDYVSSLAAGLVTVLEHTYQAGDWIEIDGTYGEVKSIGIRAVRIVTPDETEVSIPHSRLWSARIFNASSGERSLLCVAEFYLHPEHDASLVRRRLASIVESSSYWKPDTSIQVIVFQQPWGVQYRLKAYVKDSRSQFLFITDLTVRGQEMLRSMGVRFAQATYAETSP